MVKSTRHTISLIVIYCNLLSHALEITIIMIKFVLNSQLFDYSLSVSRRKRLFTSVYFIWKYWRSILHTSFASSVKYQLPFRNKRAIIQSTNPLVHIIHKSLYISYLRFLANECVHYVSNFSRSRHKCFNYEISSTKLRSGKIIRTYVKQWLILFIRPKN